MTRVAALVTACTAVMWLAAPAPARAQDALDRLLGQPISSVELQVEGRPETAAPLLALIDIKPGDRFSVENYRRVTSRFNQVPRFESIQVLADERPAGLVLIFNLEPRHPVDRLEFRGETGLTDTELQRLVREQFNGLPAFARLTEVEDAVGLILRNEGYQSPQVSPQIVRLHDPDRSTLVIDVQAGPRTTIRTVKIEGDSPFSRDEILRKLDIAPGRPYRERALSAGLIEIRDELRGRGFYTAVAQFQPARLDQPEVDLVLTIRAGPLVRLVLKGDDLPGRVEDFIPIRRQGSVDQDLLDDSQRETERELKRQGYWRALVSYSSEIANGERIITFTTTRGKRYHVDRVALPAGLHVTPADVSALPALKPGVRFSEEAVTRAMFALKATYQELGYYEVTLDPKYEEIPGGDDREGGVIIHPNVVEGRRAIVTGISFDLGDRPVVTEPDLRRLMRAREQAPYVPAHLFYDTQAIASYYGRQGFLNHAPVQIRPQFNEAGTEAVLRVQAREGERVTVGEITVVGNERVSRDVILREIPLKTGQPYSEAARVESQNRLYNLAGFRTVTVTAQPRLPGETETRIVISVVETGAVTFGFGGGVEAGTTPRSVAEGGVEDRLEFSPRVSIDVGRRNIGGVNREVNLFGRVSLKPRNAPGDPERDGKGFGFTEYRVSATFRERYAFRTDTELLFGATSEQAVRTAYSYLRRSVSGDLLRPLSPQLSVSGRYSLEVTRLFDERIAEGEQLTIDRLFPQLRLSLLSATVFWDRRDNQISASTGSLVTTTLDFAPRWLGSEVGFVKAFFEGSIYRPILAPRRLILAARAQLGLAHGFERRVLIDDIEEILTDLPASHRFFTGGSTTVRGFQLDRLGVHEVLDANGLSRGGNAMMVVNGELRAAAGRPFGRALTVVGFVDAGNVFDRVGDFDLGRIRATTGVGFRYDSPFGPVRLDVGVKMNRFTFANGRERRWEFHLSIGEVF